MNYTTEAMNRMAQALAEMIKTEVIKQQEAGKSEIGIAQIETEMREALKELGGQTLRIFLNSMQTTPANEIACPCGGKLEYQRKRSATIISVFGRVEYERAYYAGCSCKQGKAPLDEKFGLKPGAVTAGLAALLALAGVGFSYDQSPKWLYNYLLFDISENTVRSETEQMGELQDQYEKALIEKTQDEAYLQERQRNPGRIVPRRYGSIDAAKVRIEPRPKKGEEKEKHEDWRDLKVLCWFEVETVPASQRSVRQRKKAEREQVVMRAKNKQYFCDIIEAEEFGKLLWATGCTVNADLSPELIFLGDGAIWIWNLVTRYYRNAVQIVDWFHAEEHLEDLARAAFPDLPQRTVWLEDAKQALWEGRVEDVIAACQALASSCSAALDEVTYFSNNIERMRYAQFRAAGYMIGSGTIESGCKQVATFRLKLPGAQWIVTGAVRTAKARAAWLSGFWQPLCSLRSTLPLAV
jgi:hypothetical protein